MRASASSADATGSTGAKLPTRQTSVASGAAALHGDRRQQREETGGDGSQNPDLTPDDPVAFSSRMIAAARAFESRRADRLFSDPYAELLAGPDAMQVAEYRRKAKADEEVAAAAEGAADTTMAAVEREARGSERRLAIRTRFCDDFFEDCAGRREIKQIVSVGAGMDTRGLRLKASEGTKVFEVDQAIVLRVKSALLMAATAADEVAASVAGFRERRDGGVGQARVVSVEADLSVEGWEGELFEAGFDPNQPSAWILEGLTMYLEEQELVSLIRVISKLSSPGSAFCATTVSAESVKRAQAGMNALMGTWKWGSDDPQAFFTDTFPEGWSFSGVPCGTPGEFPDGADYGVGFVGKAPAYVIGYLASGCHLHLTELRAATELLHNGAKATTEHFQDNELSSKNLGDIVDLLSAHSFSGAWSAVAPELAAFLDALTSSGSEAILTNKRYVGNGGMPLPFFVLHSVTVGEPWGDGPQGSTESSDVGSSRDRAFRRICLRLLARMAFLSAERRLARGAAHPFMALLETKHGPETYGEMLPFEEVRAPRLAHPTNQSAFLQVVFLMMFVYRRLPWSSREQYLADAQYRDASRPLFDWGGVQLKNQLCTIILGVPGVLQALVVDGGLWHVLVAHGIGIRVDPEERPLGFTFKRNLGEYCLNDCFGSKTEEDKLIVLLRDTRLLSKWFCGVAGRYLLLEVCRQRRRRVVQAVAKGAPVAFAAVVPDLLAFVRGPSVRGKKERLSAWLESMLERG
eukprot:g7674.t1